MESAFFLALHCICFYDIGLGKERVCKAHHLADISQELAMLIRARQKMKPDKENEECADVDQRPPLDKARKIARMNRVRQVEGIPDAAPVVVSYLIICFAVLG